MKISELSRASGESIPTIKFYIREGLLPPGEPTAKNQADYGVVHVERLALVRALRDELGMSLDKVGEVLRSAERGGQRMLSEGLKAASEARREGVALSASERAQPELGRAWAELLELERQLGWDVAPGDPASVDAARALATILRVMPGVQPREFLPAYARAMAEVAEMEIPDDFDPDADPWGSLRLAVLGTYAFEPLILALRRMAHRERATRLARQRDPAPRTD